MTLSIKVALLTTLAALSVTSGTGAAPAPANSGAAAFLTSPGGNRTRLQSALMQAIETRRAQGLPVPAVTFGYQAIPEVRVPVPGRTDDGRQSAVIATTTIRFDDPSQAGRDRWPDFVVAPGMPSGARGFTRAGDYTQLVRDKLEQQIPDIWTRYEFGSEPRTYTFTERITITYPEDARGTGVEAEKTTFGDLLMGFTFEGPNIDYTIDECLEVLGADVACLKAGLQFDYGAGMRLPMEVGLTGSEPMLEGSSYYLSSLAQGLNWTAADYLAAGVPEESGNEFVLRLVLFAGIKVDVFGEGVVEWGIDINENHSTSFMTPLGPGASFSIPPFDIPLWTDDVPIVDLELGLRLTPSLGSDRFTADWAASADASGSGDLTYSDTVTPISVGPVDAIDGPSTADIQLDNFRYYFTTFDLKLQMYVFIDVFVTSATFPVDIGQFDLGGFTSGLYVGTHDGTPEATGISLEIDNVAPTAEIDRTGAVSMNGVPTFIAQPGQVLSFTGESQDPGRDDLTLTWDWDDGPPAPDESTTYPVPHQVTESQLHGFGDACLYNVTFKSVDDDGAVGEDAVPVLVQGVLGAPARLAGYWQHQMGQNGATDFDTAALECLLKIVGHASSVFDEARDAATVGGAYDVLFLAHNGGSRAEKFDRELLITWLNFAVGAYGYAEMLDTDGDMVPDAIFSDIMSAAEAVRLDPDATDTDLKQQTQLLHGMNSAYAGALAARTRATIEPVAAGTGSVGADNGAQTVPEPTAEGVAVSGLRPARTLPQGLGISFALASGAAVDMRIFDIGGRVVRTLEGTFAAGGHTMLWDGTADSGARVTSGVYFILMRSGGQVWRTKGILMR